MTTDLITGGAGFIGSHLVRYLVRLGRRVRVIDDLSTGSLDRLEGLLDKLDFVHADLASADLRTALKGILNVYHLAAVPSVPRSVADPMVAHSSIATASLRLLLAAREAGASRVVLSSSSSVYGDASESPKHESLPHRPLSPYAVAKAAAEDYAQVFARLYGLHTVTLRYFNVFGPAQDPRSAYAAVIPLFIRHALSDEPLTVFGDGRQTRDFTYVQNVVEANLRATVANVSSGSVYNVAAGRPRTIRELVATLEEIVGKPLDVRYAPPRPGDIVHSHAALDRTRIELGWSPSVDFPDGLRRTVDWYRSS